uniref:Uncharacterized protein n=1 Tax=viral metagenome TaxID=1070528 RepID=A0A6C0C238_9ZZZZ
MENSRHPFRNVSNASLMFRIPDKTRLLSTNQQTSLNSQSDGNLKETTGGKALTHPWHVPQRINCCCVQGVQCSTSAPLSLLHIATHLQHTGTSLLVFFPCEFVNEYRDNISDSISVMYYTCLYDLKHMIHTCNPQCILLSSHDKRFGSLRRDSRAIRWAHETPRAYDPQASRCVTPLYGTGKSSLMALSGYVGMARSFCSFEHLSGGVIEYTPGPIRILGCGDISNPRVNFKAFQYLSEKHSSILFMWHGATRNKTWGNLQLCTPDVSKQDLYSKSDYLLWCAEDDPCPLTVFEALYVGVRVYVFEKVTPYDLQPLLSDKDGSALLNISRGAPQHCPLHTAGKNTKISSDIEQARKYVREFVEDAPSLLVEHIQRLTGCMTRDSPQ